MQRNISQNEIDELFKIPTDKFKIFEGKYPERYHKISILSEKVIDMKLNNVIPDKAKSIINTERKEHTQELINLNETEKTLLISGFYNITFPKFNKSKLCLTKEFVLNLRADAVVNTANEALLGGGGMDLLIHTYAGDSLKDETSQLPNVTNEKYYYDIKCLTGDSKITSGHNLPFKYIIHTVTPYLKKNNNTDKDNHIKCYQSILNYINGKEIRSIVIGPISTGYYGYPMLEAAILGLKTIIDFINKYESNIDIIYLWIYNQTQFKIFDYLLK
jgi:O-acetyl-ADP-ribose deacetylase (regulator of RNase III)